MTHRLRDVPALLGTPVGRIRLRLAATRRLWPLLAPPAALYRRTVIRRARVIAVTGSFGKTTTARAIMASLGSTQATLSPNYGGFVALALLGVRPRQRHLVLEIGISGPNEMAGYARTIRPDVAVVTCIGSEHHPMLGGLEATRREKSLLVSGLDATGAAVLNGDDPHVRWMRDRTRARVTTFGFGTSSDVRAGEPMLDGPRGTGFEVSTSQGTREVHVNLVGRPGVYAALAAVAVALSEGVSLDQAIENLHALAPTPGRLQPVMLPGGAVLLRDEFKSAEETIEVALDALAAMAAARRLVVLGEVTDAIGSPSAIHRRLGERIAGIVSRAIFVTDDGAADYLAGAARGGLSGAAAQDVGPRARAAVEALRDDLRAGDVVLIKGRGTQRLDRVALALMGRQVRCDLTFCDVKIRCDVCPMLERGW